MTKRLGYLAEKTPCYGLRSSWVADHKLGPRFTVSDAQLRDDAWRADFEDHRLDRAPPETQIPVFNPATLRHDYCETHQATRKGRLRDVHQMPVR